MTDMRFDIEVVRCEEQDKEKEVVMSQVKSEGRSGSSPMPTMCGLCQKRAFICGSTHRGLERGVHGDKIECALRVRISSFSF